MIRQKRKLRHPLISGILTLLLACMGCSSGPEPVIDTAPGWLESISQDQNHYYAIGISGPTPRVTDAWDQTIRRARAALGRVIISHVTSKDTIISTSGGEYIKQIVKTLSDAELNYTEVIEKVGRSVRCVWATWAFLCPGKI